MKKMLKLVGIGFVALVIIGLVSGVNNNTNTVVEQKKQSVENEEQSTSSKYVFDVPSLIGMDLTGVIKQLGSPKGIEPTAQQISMGIKEWDKTFVKDGTELLVTYNIADNKIIDFFIGTDDPSGATRDKRHLLDIGNLSETSTSYTVVYVKAIKDPSVFTGVKIIPKY